jgi:membrane associated rhomboid family serine protease
MFDILLASPVTLTLLVINIGVSLYALYSNPSFLERYAFVPERIWRHNEWYRMVTAGFLHVHLPHLIFNMITLYFFAEVVERSLSPAMFLVLYITGVIVAFIPTTLRHMKNPRYNSLGASGAVAAVMFCAILMKPDLKVSFAFLPIGIPGIFYALGYLAYSAYSAYRARDGINHGAHLTGALYGTLFTFVLQPSRVIYALQHLF